MKVLTERLQKGDRIWAQPSDSPEGTLRPAEVMTIIRIPNESYGSTYAAIRYLDPQNGFECIPLASVKALCDHEEQISINS